MSANMRATPPPSSSGRHGSTANVDASGTAIMSDSSIALKPVIDEPSNPMPPSNASSSWSELMLNDFSWPRTSVNQSRMKRMPRSSTSALTSSCVMRGSLGDPAIRPALELAQGRRELAPLLRELVLHAHRALAGDAALDDAARLEFLHALREQAVGEVGHCVRDLREAHGAAVQQDVEDRAGPAAADELDGLVQAWAAGRPQGALLLDGAVHGDLAGDVDHGREGFHGEDRDGLQELLVAPAGLPRLLLQVLGLGLALGQRAQVAQEGRLARVARVPAAGERHLVEPDARAAGGALVQRDAGLGAVVLGDGERDPLDGGARQAGLSQLGAEAQVGAQRGRRAGEHAEQVGQLAGRRARALEDRERRLWRRELVVDCEAADAGLRHWTYP